MNNNTKYQWDLSPYYASDNDPMIAVKMTEATEAVNAFASKWKDRTDYLENARVLKEALDDYEALFAKTGLDNDIVQFLWLRLQTELNNKELIQKNAEFEEKYITNYNTIQFFSLSLGTIPKDTQQDLLRDDGLKDYKNYLQSIFDGSAYLLSEKEEKIINLLSSNASDKWVNTLAEKFASEKRELVIDGETVEASITRLKQYLLSETKEHRDNAAVQIYDILHSNSFFAEKEMNAFLEYRKIENTLRSYPRVDTIAHQRDLIDSEVVDALIEGVNENYDIVHDYYILKAKYLKQDVLSYHDRLAPLFKKEDLPRFTWDQISSTVKTIFDSVDGEFGAVVKDLIDNRRIDIFARQNKRGGGFCTFGSPRVGPYIFLNMEESLDSVRTFAHECGHALHHTYFHANQNSLNATGTLFTAESASMLMEGFAQKHLEDMYRDDHRMSVILLMSKIERAASAIFRQIAGYQFELELHRTYAEEGYMSHTAIGDMFSKYNKVCFGDSVQLEHGSESMWMNWMHLRSPFYVYTYASGNLISAALLSEYEKDNEFLEKIKTFFKDGRYHSAHEQFARMGIDIADKQFWIEGIRVIRKDLEKLKTLLNND